jgi:hypothetical protein
MKEISRIVATKNSFGLDGILQLHLAAIYHSFLSKKQTAEGEFNVGRTTAQPDYKAH